MEKVMKYNKTIFAIIMSMLLGFSSIAVAKEGNWKKGRIYYKMVCSECHLEKAGGKISPSEKTKAEWLDYFEKNIHGPQDAPCLLYTSDAADDVSTV